MSDWEYSVAFLAWENKKTGELSETDPKVKITPVKEDKEEMQRNHDELGTLSAVLAYRRLWPEDEDAIRQAFITMGPHVSTEAVERAIERTRKVVL